MALLVEIHERVALHLPSLLCSLTFSCCLLGDLVVDLELPKSSGKSFPKRLDGMQIGMRLDAIDHKGQWYSGQWEKSIQLQFVL
jgi:hypothetical protein